MKVIFSKKKDKFLSTTTLLKPIKDTKSKVDRSKEKMEEERPHKLSDSAILQKCADKKAFSIHTDFKQRKDHNKMEENGVLNICCQQKEETGMFLSSEPWSPGQRNEHEMLRFHLNRF